MLSLEERPSATFCAADQHEQAETHQQKQKYVFHNPIIPDARREWQHPVFPPCGTSISTDNDIIEPLLSLWDNGLANRPYSLSYVQLLRGSHCGGKFRYL